MKIRCWTRPTSCGEATDRVWRENAGMPWGISESGYNTVDAHLNYQYRAFGVPGLGLETRPWRGSGHCALCLSSCPDGRARRGLRESGAAAAEGVRTDSTACMRRSTIRRRGSPRAIALWSARIMAHHQGMSFLSLRLSAPRPADAEALRDPILCSRPPRCSYKNGFQGHGVLFALTELSDLRTTSSAPETPVRVFRIHPTRRSPDVAALVERPLSRDGDECGRRVQSLERSRRDALARRQHLRQLGNVLLHPRR